MMSLTIPRTAQDLTPAWLTDALRGAGVLDDARVTRLLRQPIGAESGLTSEVVRLRPSYSAIARRAPASLVAKLASTNDAVRSRQHRVGGNYGREVRFYRDMAGGMPIRSPRCFHAAVDEADGWLILLLEDLEWARAGDDETGCSAEDAAAALRAAARLHAEFWESPRLRAMEWLQRPPRPALRAADDSHAVFARALDQLGTILSPRLISVLQAALEAIERGALRPTGPPTMVHGDFSAKNMVFVDGSGGTEVIVFDWALAATAPAARDVTLLITLGLPSDRLRVEAERLLRLYHASLEEAGVRGFTFDHLLLDYRRVVLQRAIGALGLVGGVVAPTPVRLTTAQRIIERTEVTLEDFDPWPLLSSDR